MGILGGSCKEEREREWSVAFPDKRNKRKAQMVF